MTLTSILSRGAGALVLAALMLTTAPVQALPLGLNTVGPVQSAGSDSQATNFMNNELPAIQTFINNNTLPNQDYAPPGVFQSNPANIFWAEERDLRVYFISEEAGYQNSLGFSHGNDFTLTPGDPSLIFPNSSSPNPLMLGDFVDIGVLSPNTLLNFYLLANGFVDQNPNIIWTNSAFNQPADALQHYYSVNQFGSNYLLYSVEDLPLLGDADFDDLHFVVEALPTPEPQTYLLMGLFLSGILYLRKREESKLAPVEVQAKR